MIKRHALAMVRHVNQVNLLAIVEQSATREAKERFLWQRAQG